MLQAIPDCIYVLNVISVFCGRWFLLQKEREQFCIHFVNHSFCTCHTCYEIDSCLFDFYLQHMIFSIKILWYHIRTFAYLAKTFVTIIWKSIWPPLITNMPWMVYWWKVLLNCSVKYWNILILWCNVSFNFN